MAKRLSASQGREVRAEACRLATEMLRADGQWDGQESSDRLWSLCVFFESHIVHGAKKTRRDMGLMRVAKPIKAPVIRLITRD